MPHETTLYDDGVYWRYTGAIPFSEFVEAKSEVWGLPQWESFRFKVTDLLAADTPVINAVEAKAFTHFDKPSGRLERQMRIAIAVKDPDWIALVRAYIDALDVAGWKAEIFDSLEDAFAWARPDRCGNGNLVH